MLDITPYLARGDGNIVFAADCPSRSILDQVADKWSMMTVAVLEQPTRFNEIKRRLSRVTQRVLTQTLRRLERNGMITRRIIPTSPVGVEYALTPLGESLREPFCKLYDWTIEHAATIRGGLKLATTQQPEARFAATVNDRSRTADLALVFQSVQWQGFGVRLR